MGDTDPKPVPPDVLDLYRALTERIGWGGADVVQYLTETWFPARGIDPDTPPGAYRPAVPADNDPPDLAQRVRDKVRRDHARCDPAACPLSQVWREDVAEILTVAAWIRRTGAA